MHSYSQTAASTSLKYQNRPFHPTNYIASAPVTHYCSLLEANPFLCGSDWLSQTARTHSLKCWVPKSSLHHILTCNSLTSSSYNSVQVAVRTKKLIDQKELKWYSLPTYLKCCCKLWSVHYSCLYCFSCYLEIEDSMLPSFPCAILGAATASSLVSLWEGM